MYIGELFGKYPVKFNVEPKLSIIIGTNGSGKTLTLELLREHFRNENENVMYFPFERVSNVTEDDLDSTAMMCSLLGINVFQNHGINLENSKKDIKYYEGEYITSGIIQLINFYVNIMNGGSDLIVLIDLIETNLDMHGKRSIVDEILSFPNVKKLIVVTHSPEVAGDHINDIVQIDRCVRLH